MKNEKESSLPVALRPGIYQLPAEKPGSHAYLIKGKTKNVLIDPGLIANFPLLASQLQTLGLGVKDIHFVILTHEHFDHIEAITFFDAAVIAAHALAANKIELQDEFVTYTTMKEYRVHLWLEEGVVIDLDNYKLQIIHTPGHTSGCICIYEPGEKVLFAGDAVFAGGLLSEIAGSGNISDYVSSLHRLSTLKVEALYPGHGLLSATPEEDIYRGVENARAVMEESKLLFGALAKSESRAEILKRVEKAPFSGMARPTKKSEGKSGS